MLFRKSKEELTQKLENLWAQESNSETDKKVFELATQLVREDESNYKALYVLAQCYHLGIGTNVDSIKAVELYDLLSRNSAFDREDVNFQYKFARALEEAEDDRCFLWYLDASRNGDQWSTYLLGSLLLEGKQLNNVSYTERYALAIKFLNKAVQMACEDDVTQQAKDLLALSIAKNKVILLEIDKQHKIFSLLNDAQRNS